jgi:hypothetical protein
MNAIEKIRRWSEGYCDPVLLAEDVASGEELDDESKAFYALNRLLDYVEWLMARGIVMSGPSSYTNEALRNIVRDLGL